MRQATAKAILTRGSISVLRIEDAGSGYTSPPTVTLSAPKDGGKRATATATWLPTRDEEALLLCKKCEEALKGLCKTDLGNTEAPSIILWMPKEANETLKNSGSFDTCNHPCAVVRFGGPHAEERADALVNKFETLKNKLCNPLKNAKGEHLSQGYKALEDCKTYQRITSQESLGAGRFVGRVHPLA
jgi:hypothetical protein